MYLLDIETTTPLHLMPFIQIRRGAETEEDACYFYMGRRNGNVRFVSYHFEHEADIDVPDSSVISTIDALVAKN